jgi:hypothetical protein
VIQVVRVPQGFVVRFQCERCRSVFEQPSVRLLDQSSKAADAMEPLRGDITPEGWQLLCDACSGRPASTGFRPHLV